MNARNKAVMRIFEYRKPIDWERVISRELPKIYNYFRYNGLSDQVAEDLTSVSIEKAWRAQERYTSEKAALSTWLMTIARRTMIDYFRGLRPENSIDSDESFKNSLKDSIQVEDLAELRDDIERLRNVLAMLPDREREIIALKYGAQMTNRQIARITGVSESNVGTLLCRVINSLRKQMEI